MSQQGASFLDLPTEIQEMIYELAFTPPEYCNLLDLVDTVYTKATAPLLYVHPSISTDLSYRLYKDGFAAVVPIQDQNEFLEGRGFCHSISDPEASVEGQSTLGLVGACMKQPSVLMKSRCKKLIVEVSQLSEDDKHWECDHFPKQLMPLLLAIRKEMPALEKVQFIFWFGKAVLNHWQPHLEFLAEHWDDHVKKDLMGVGEGTDKGNEVGPRGDGQQERHKQRILSNEDESNPVQDIDFDVFDETLDRNFNETSSQGSTRLHVLMQLNLFNYSDPDAGDGGMNYLQGWDIFASKTWKSNAALRLSFSAMDLDWRDHVRGNFEGREFEPMGWAYTYINTTNKEDRDERLHKYYFVTKTCRPLYVTTIPAEDSEME